jgi:hypothetical protein
MLCLVQQPRPLAFKLCNVTCRSRHVPLYCDRSSCRLCCSSRAAGCCVQQHCTNGTWPALVLQNGTTPLLVAAQMGHIQLVSKLLRSGAGVDVAMHVSPPRKASFSQLRNAAFWRHVPGCPVLDLLVKNPNIHVHAYMRTCVHVHKLTSQTPMLVLSTAHLL